MEGIIPFVYRAIMQYKTGGQATMEGTWLDDSPSGSYVRLPGDSGRFQSSETPLFHQDRNFSLSTTSAMSSASQLLLSAAAQSPLTRRLVS